MLCPLSPSFLGSPRSRFSGVPSFIRSANGGHRRRARGVGEHGLPARQPAGMAGPRCTALLYRSRGSREREGGGGGGGGGDGDVIIGEYKCRCGGSGGRMLSPQHHRTDLPPHDFPRRFSDLRLDLGVLETCSPFHQETGQCIKKRDSTVLVLRMANRIWKETKQQPGTAGPGNMLGCC